MIGRKHYIARTVSLLIILSVVCLLSVFSEPEQASFRTLVILLMAFVFWVSGLIHETLTGILVMLFLYIFSVLSFDEAFSGFSSSSTWLLIAGFMLADSMISTGLDKKIAIGLMKLARGRIYLTSFTILFSVYILVFLVPTAAGRIAVILPACIGLVKFLNLSKQSNFAKVIFIGIAIVSNAASYATITGSTAVIYAHGVFKTTLGVDWSYFQWFIVFFPPSLLIFLLIWLLLIGMFRPERVGKREDLLQFVNEEWRKTGRFEGTQIKVILIFIITLIGWATESIHHVSISAVALVGVMLMVLPGIGFLDIKEAIQKVQWSVVILFSSTLSLAYSLGKYEVFGNVAVLMKGLITDLSVEGFILLLLLLIIVIRIGFVSNVGSMAVLLLIAFSLAEAYGFDSAWAGLVVVFSIGMGIFIPTQTTATIYCYSFGEFQMKDLIRFAFLFLICALPLFYLVTRWYWPWLGVEFNR